MRIGALGSLSADYPQEQARIQRGVIDVFDAMEKKDLPRLDSYHACGPKFTKFGITASYWASEEAIAVGREHLDHGPAQQAGQRVWYADDQLRVAKVERAYGKPPAGGPGAHTSS
jgi:hypothetical protein